jgi:hypothetical protein
MSGARPVFIDHIDSVFFFPYQHIRFVEMPPGADRTATGEGRDLAVDTNGLPADGPAEADADLEIDEDFLRRIREA